MKTIALTVILSFFVACSNVFAQEEAHSDIEFSYVDGAIDVEPGEEGFVFEGEFGEGLFANTASEPGFGSELEEGLGINPNNIVGFNLLDQLYYWDGTQFTSAGDTTITIGGVGGAADTVVSATSGVQLANFSVPSQLVGQADASGDLHVDLDFTISDGAPVGGYGLLMSLASDDPAGIADSNPFGVFLNFGLEEEAFESGVEAFSEVVPEPSALTLFMCALFGFGCARRKR